MMDIDIVGADISIDTRTLQKGETFIAIKGEDLDGHDYVEKAFALGAKAAVVKSDYVVPAHLAGQTFYFVNDTLVALQDLAREHLKRMPAQRIALTGSSGKTTTKELTRCALAACLGDDAVIATAGTFNNHIGLPLSALKVRKEHKAAVFELGMNHFGEISFLAQIVRPHVGLIINMGTAHAEFLGGPDGVAKAKAELFENLSTDAIAIVNIDDPRCQREAESKVHSKRFNFGKAPWADLRLKSVQTLDPTRSRISFSYQNRVVEIELPMPGVHNALNATAALAVACAMGLDFETAAKGLQDIQGVKGRLFHHQMKDGGVLIDDSYNANPESMEAGLNVLASYAHAPRRIAVLGEMAELGEKAFDLHRSIGALLAHKNVDLLFTCGKNAMAYNEGAIAEGFDRSRIVWAENSEALAPKVFEVAKSTDVIFVKGSKSTKMGKVVEKLLGNCA